MSFTVTVRGNGPGPSRANEGEHVEIQSYVNTAGSTGGVITARWLKSIDRVIADNTLNRTISGNTVTLVTDANSSGDVELYGRT